LIAPGAGTIIGGLSASKISKEDVRSFEILISFEDMDFPSVSIEIPPVIEIAQEWNGRIHAIIRSSENPPKVSQNAVDETGNVKKCSGRAYTLEDLNDMLHMGMITESDYEEKIRVKNAANS
jgi:hypothetical protein